jgi:outer membrane receptor protein involved in Fe transport
MVTIARGEFKPEFLSEILIDTLHTAGKTSSYMERIANNQGAFRNVGSTISFKHNFPKAGREWTADVIYNNMSNSNSNLITTNYYNVPQYDLTDALIEQQKMNGKNQNLVMQTDFENPINDKSKLEMGARVQFRTNESANAFYTDVNGQWILQPSSVADYESEDHVYAAYATYSNQLKNFGYQLGLRAESSDYDGTLLKTGEKFNTDYPISLFPSLFLTQKLRKDQGLQLNYSRRINRPNFWQLTPFTDSSDKLNPSRGNPALKPEFTNSVELSYEKTFENKDNLIISAYYKYTDDLITRYQVAEDVNGGGETIILNTYINANSSYGNGS